MSQHRHPDTATFAEVTIDKRLDVDGGPLSDASDDIPDDFSDLYDDPGEVVPVSLG